MSSKPRITSSALSLLSAPGPPQLPARIRKGPALGRAAQTRSASSSPAVRSTSAMPTTGHIRQVVRRRGCGPSSLRRNLVGYPWPELMPGHIRPTEGLLHRPAARPHGRPAIAEVLACLEWANRWVNALVHPYWTGVRVRGGRDQGRVDIATGAPVLVDPGSTLCGCRTAYSPLRGPSCRRYSRSPARPCAASPRTPGAGSALMPSIPGTRRSWR